MVEPEYVFTTIAVQYKAGGLPPAGFFCLWDRELTFVASKWVQLVLPIPLIGMLPIDRRPSGPDDSRTRAQISYSDIARVTPTGRKVVVHTFTGKEHHFGGAGFNSAFGFETVAPEIAKALEAAGFAVTLTTSALTVEAPGYERAPGIRSSPIPRRDVPDDKVAIPPVSAWRAVAFGVGAALLAAAAAAMFSILTGYNTSLATVGVGIAVASAVSYGAASRSRKWAQFLAIFLTLVGLAAAEYPIALHYGGATGSSVWLSPSYITEVFRQDIRTNPITLLFWGFALFIAWATAKGGNVPPSGASEEDSTDVGGAPRHLLVVDQPQPRNVRLWVQWLVASTALAVGAASLVILARVPIGSTGRDRPSIPQHADHPIPVPLEAVIVGDCFNLPSSAFDTLPELPCGQPHDSEVFYLYSMNPGTYPGDDQVYALAMARCGDQLTSYARQEDIGLLWADGITPDSGTWRAGNRSVICALYRTDEAKLASSERAPHKPRLHGSPIETACIATRAHTI